MSDQRPASGEEKSLEVVRDSTFTRFVADEAVINLVGRELEVAFLQYGPMLVRQIEQGEFERTESRNVVTEVARMRMGNTDFMQMVMEFLRSGINGGWLKGDAIGRTIAEWTAEAAGTVGEEEVEAK